MARKTGIIVVEKTTARKPEVLGIAAALNIHPDHALGLCIRFWNWVTDNALQNGFISVTPALLNALLERDGFAEAAISVGWLQVREGSLAIPNFDRHLAASAVKAALSARRVAKHRAHENGNASVTLMKRSRNTNCAKGGKGGSLPVLNSFLDTEEFRERLAQWLAYKQSKKQSYKPEGLRAMLSRAETVGRSHGLIAVCDAMQRAMANGWQGWDQPSLFDKKQAVDRPRAVGGIGDENG